MLRRLVTLAVILGLIACSRTVNGALPSGGSPAVINHRILPHGVTFTYRVMNSHPGTILQTVQSHPCLLRYPSSGNLAYGSATDYQLEIDPNCAAASLTIGFVTLDPNSQRYAAFTFMYSKLDGSVKVDARGWNYMCGQATNQPTLVGIRVFQGLPGSPGCYKSGGVIVKAKPTSFHLTVENRTGLRLDATTRDALCITNTPAGKIPASAILAYTPTLTAGSGCKFSAHFITDFATVVGGRRKPIESLEWDFEDPKTFTIGVNAATGYCGARLPDNHVRFYKPGANGC